MLGHRIQAQSFVQVQDLLAGAVVTGRVVTADHEGALAGAFVAVVFAGAFFAAAAGAFLAATGAFLAPFAVGDGAAGAFLEARGAG